jgi:hypothetical protein
MSARKDETAVWYYTFEIQKCETPIFLSRNKTINTIHNKLQAFLKLLEFRIIGSAGGADGDRCGHSVVSWLYKDMVEHCLGEALESRFNESRCYRLMNGAKTHHKARAHRAWRRNAERMARNWERSLWGGRIMARRFCLSLNLD